MFANDAKRCIIPSGIPITYVDPFSPRSNLNDFFQANKSHMLTPIEFCYVKTAILQVCQYFLDLCVTPNTKINSKNETQNVKFFKKIRK